MKKKITKRNFIALAVVACLLLVLTVFSFNIPFTTYTFKGFAQSINLGLDFGDGTRATYTVTNSDYSQYSDEEFLEKPLSHKSHMLLHTDHQAWEMPRSRG